MVYSTFQVTRATHGDVWWDCQQARSSKASRSQMRIWPSAFFTAWYFILICFFSPFLIFCEAGCGGEATRNTCLPRPAAVIPWLYVELALCLGLWWRSLTCSWPHQTIPTALRQDINSGDFRLGDFKVMLDHMEMILRATAIKIIILLGGKSNKKCPQKRFQWWLQDLSQVCKRLLWSPRLIYHCYL